MTICQKIFIAEYGAHGGCGKILHRTSVFSYEFYGGAHGGCGIIYYRTPRPIEDRQKIERTQFLIISDNPD